MQPSARLEPVATHRAFLDAEQFADFAVGETRIKAKIDDLCQTRSYRIEPGERREDGEQAGGCIGLRGRRARLPRNLASRSSPPPMHMS